MSQTQDPVNVKLIGGPLHACEVKVEREQYQYTAEVSGTDKYTVALYASNGADTAEFVFAGYTHGPV